MHMTKGGDYVALRLGGSGYAHDYKEVRAQGRWGRLRILGHAASLKVWAASRILAPDT